MENLDQDILDLIAKHLKGETSEKEEQLLERWINERSENLKAYEEFSLLWNAGNVSFIKLPSIDNAWEQVQSKAGIEKNETDMYVPKGKIRSLFQNTILMRIAASVALILVVTYIIKNMWSHESNQVMLTATNAKKEFYLPDSSKITLNKNSTLSYSQGYNEENRIVNLTGEAFFEVKKDKSRPFIVLGKASKTQVLGTSFNVITGNGNQDIVQVLTGKVSFGSRGNKENESVILLPGDMATFTEQGTIEKSKIEDENFLSWQNDKLEFDNKPLAKVLPCLESYYDVKLSVDNPALYNCRFTGSFEKASIEEVLNVLSVSFSISYKKQSNESFLLQGGCN